MFGEKKEKENEGLKVTLLEVILWISVISLIVLMVLLFKLDSGKGAPMQDKNPISAIDLNDKDWNVVKNAEEGKTVEWLQEKASTWETENLTVTFIADAREPATDVTQFVDWMKADFPSIANAEVVVKDFLDEWTKDFIKNNGIEYLPAVIFSTNNYDSSKDSQDLSTYLEELPNWEFTLAIGANYDPFGEDCSNGIDDNEDWKIDCEDDKCSSDLTCSPKVDKPVAELFIMSYCPYWTQAEKWFLEAMLKLDDVVDMKIRFVDYVMHGEDEWEQNLVQYCIQKEQEDKFKDYLKCFLTDGDNETCLDEIWIDKNELNTCVINTKETINYDENMADETRQYPLFTLDQADNEKYGVQGSPTFVLNGIKVENVWRSAKAYADIICSTFENKPAVCDEEFSDTVYDPNFWFTSNWATVSWACGG